MVKNRILYILLLFFNYSLFAQIPQRPAIPKVMYQMSNDTFGVLFFNEINLDYPGLGVCKTYVLQGDYTNALKQYKIFFLNRLNNFYKTPYSLANWSGNNLYDYNYLTNSTTVKFFQNNVICDLGLPFSRHTAADMNASNTPNAMEWMKPLDFQVFMYQMWHPKSILIAIENKKNGGNIPYSEEFMFTRWRDIWRDYSNNAWNANYRLVNSQTLRNNVLAYYGLSTAPIDWGSSASTQQMYLLSILISNYLESLKHIGANLNTEAELYFGYRSLAEINYFMMVWPSWNLDNQGQSLEAGLIAQRTIKAQVLLDVATNFPEFKRATNFYTDGNSAMNYIVDPKSLFGDNAKDGGGQELSYNYSTNNIMIANEVKELANYGITPYWIFNAQNMTYKRERLYKNLYTNLGCQVLCKGAYDFGKMFGIQSYSSINRLPYPSSYSSIAFPYHGLYMMRKGFTSNDFFISLQSPRRGSGHEANDANKIMLEAYGRYMLVANPGEGGLWGSSWVQNTVNVDGQPQAKTLYPYEYATNTPLNGIWHTNDDFSIAETEYKYGYGTTFSTINNRVQHNRKVVYLKQANMSFVIDDMLTSDNINHSYEQIWNFHKDFPNANVVADTSIKKIVTNQPNQPNLIILQTSPASIGYTKYYGQNYPGNNSNTLPYNLTDFDNSTTGRGWFNNADGYGFNNNVYPSPTVHTLFSGSGNQKIISALIPTPTASSRISSYNRIETTTRVGFEIILTDGTKVNYYEAIGPTETFSFPILTAKSLLVTQTPNGKWKGLYTGAVNQPMVNGVFELFSDTTIFNKEEIRIPDWFSWEKNSSGVEYPNYFKTSIEIVTGTNPSHLQSAIKIQAKNAIDLGTNYYYQWYINDQPSGNNKPYIEVKPTSNNLEIKLNIGYRTTSSNISVGAISNKIVISTKEATIPLNNSVCPCGFHVATLEEFSNEINSWNQPNANTALNSRLKLPLTGSRNSTNGSIINTDLGSYWTSSIINSQSKSIEINSNQATESNSNRINGKAVRCVLDR
jgi:hypothetical protein